VGCRCVAPVDITLYRAPGSVEGRDARQYFDRKGVACEDVDVTSTPDALQQMEALSGQTERPVIVVDGKVLVGFSPSLLDPIVPSLF